MLMTFTDQIKNEGPAWKNSLEIGRAALEHENRLNKLNAGFDSEESYQEFVAKNQKPFWRKFFK